MNSKALLNFWGAFVIYIRGALRPRKNALEGL